MSFLDLLMPYYLRFDYFAGAKSSLLSGKQLKQNFWIFRRKVSICFDMLHPPGCPGINCILKEPLLKNNFHLFKLLDLKTLFVRKRK